VKEAVDGLAERNVRIVRQVLRVGAESDAGCGTDDGLGLDLGHGNAMKPAAGAAKGGPAPYRAEGSKSGARVWGKAGWEEGTG
jgi:hypothetical protein